MADCGGRAVPDGWIAVNESKNLYYLCPATGQHFFTYEDLMRYVTYAKLHQLSIYDPDFEGDIKGKFGKKRRSHRRSKSAIKQRQPAATQRKQPQPGLLPMKPNLKGKENQAEENGTDSDSDSESDPDDPPYEVLSKQNSKSAINQKNQAAPHRKDDISFDSIKDQASENSSASGSDTDPDDPPYEEMGKDGTMSAMKRRPLAAAPKLGARSSPFPAKFNFPRKTGKRSSVLAKKQKLLAELPKKKARPGLLSQKPNFSDLSFDRVTNEDLSGENSLDLNSDSHPDDRPFGKVGQLRLKSAMQQNCQVAPSKERGQPSQLPEKPYISVEDEDMGVGLKGMSDNNQAGEKGSDLDSDSDSDSDFNPNDPPYDPDMEADSAGGISSKPSSPKIILYQRRSKLNKQAGGAKIGGQSH